MKRLRVALILLLVPVLLVACSGDSDEPEAALPKGDAVTVNDTTFTSADVVKALRVLAASEGLEKVLAKDDIKLVPKDGTIDPTVSQAYVTALVDQALGDEAFEQRDLKVTDEDRAEARKAMERTYRGKEIFDAFPEWFQDQQVDGQARIEALRASLPGKNDPTEAELRDLYTQVEATCQDDKLVSTIFVTNRSLADQIVAATRQGGDFAALAREHSLDPVSRKNGGVSMCIGSQRYTSSYKVLQDAVQATPIGGTSDVIEYPGGWTIVHVDPLTYDNALPLLTDDWRSRHPSALHDLLTAARRQAAIEIDPRFARVVPAQDTVAIAPPAQNVRL